MISAPSSAPMITVLAIPMNSPCSTTPGTKDSSRAASGAFGMTEQWQRAGMQYEGDDGGASGGGGGGSGGGGGGRLDKSRRPDLDMFMFNDVTATACVPAPARARPAARVV